MTYGASPIKRNRATAAEVEARRSALLDIVETMQPMTVRQVFYQASVRGLVDKGEFGYRRVQNDLVLLRRGGAMPYNWLADNTRWMRKPSTYDSIQQALNSTARLYRKALWSDIDDYVEVWLEKDALAGVVAPITDAFDVPLMVARGYASLSFLYGATEFISEVEKPTYIYHLGDFDPSGVNAGEKIEETLREMAPAADIHFERLAVTPQQIAEWRLPSRPTKTSDSRSDGFGDISVELDAIEPGKLRDIVQESVERHLSRTQYEVLLAAEASERELLRSFVRGGAHG